MEKVNIKDYPITYANVVFAKTISDCYNEDRLIVIDDYPNFILAEGGHCSCYDFDEVQWEAIKYSREELEKLASAPYNKESTFWNGILKYIRGY